VNNEVPNVRPPSADSGPFCLVSSVMAEALLWFE
jgi:hypothetical protein